MRSETGAPAQRRVRVIILILCVAALASCAPNSSTPSGGALFDADVTLARGDKFDAASREFTLDADSVVVALVDERLTDVKLSISVPGAVGAEKHVIEVENRLRGSGIEVAALEAGRGARVRVALEAAANSTRPGDVRITVRRFDKDDDKAEAFRAWATATNARLMFDETRKTGPAEMQNAIAALQADAEHALAAEASLIRANMLVFFGVDWPEGRAEARRAAAEFVALPKPDLLNEARARAVEARALREIALDRASTNPTFEEAKAAARAILEDLIDPRSPLEPIEIARVRVQLATIDVDGEQVESAKRHLEAAQAIFEAAGNVAEDLDARAALAYLLVERGRFDEAAQTYEQILPEIDKITWDERRVEILINIGRAQSFSSRSDEAAETLHRALMEARRLHLATQEGNALQELGLSYMNRGDLLQAGMLFNKGLEIMRVEKGAMHLVYALEATGATERYEGRIKHAIELHKEAIGRASHPVAHMRSIRALALDYAALNDHPEAIRQFRNSLAVPLEDPMHQAYSDVRRELADELIEHGDGSPESLAEAGRLLEMSLKQCLDVNDQMGLIGYHRVHGALLARQGKNEQAIREFERAFLLTYQFLARTYNGSMRTSTLRYVQPAFRHYFDLLMTRVVARGPGAFARASESETNALRFLERAREAHNGTLPLGATDAATRARMDTLLAQMAEKSIRIAALTNHGSPAHPDEVKSLQIEMSDLRAKVDRERTAAARRFAQSESQRARPARGWRTLAPGAVQVSYSFGNKHAYAWVRSHSGIEVAALAETPEVIERDLAALAKIDHTASEAELSDTLGRVSAALMPDGLLPKTSTSVEIVADGRIASIPFAGLRSPTDTSRLLAETHRIRQVASMYAADVPPPRGSTRPFQLVALASGSGTLRSARISDPARKLQAAVKEIRDVALLFTTRDSGAQVKLLAGADGTADALRVVWSSGVDVVHFATHALADLRQPLASLLVLPANDAEGKPTYLTAGQVQGWRGDAELVFLSACESAVGPPRFAGGMPGLQSAFLRAGAHGVIATLWPIEDLYAREFALDFYRHFAADRDAEQALVATQREWLAPTSGANADDRARRRFTALAHGYYTL